MANKRTELQDPYIVCDNWAFHIPLPAFFAALDIQKTKRTRQKKDDLGRKIINPVTNEPERKVWYVWTQSNPPAWNFAKGDMFHSNAELANGSWPENKSGYSIKVSDKQNDSLTIQLFDWSKQTSATSTISQSDLVRILKTGPNMKNEDIIFEVEGSRGDIYEVSLSFHSEKLQAHCTCPARTTCRHILEILGGDEDDIIASDNFKDLPDILERFGNCSNFQYFQSLQPALKQLEQINKEKDRIQKNINGLKKQLFRELGNY